MVAQTSFSRESAAFLAGTWEESQTCKGAGSRCLLSQAQRALPSILLKDNLLFNIIHIRNSNENANGAQAEPPVEISGPPKRTQSVSK